MASRKRTVLVSAVGAALIAGYGLVGVSAAAPAARTTSEGATISLHQTSFGKVLVGSDKHVLYVFTKDATNKSHCSAACRSIWKPVTSTHTPKAGAGVKASALKLIKGNQVTYHGSPLYTYVPDTKVGQTRGQELYEYGGYWYLVKASGAEVF